MGIKRLYSYLKYGFRDTEIKELTGKKVGIDAMGWLYQAYFGTTDNEIELKLCIIRAIEMKVKHLIKNSIEFVFVIDGKQLKCKELTRKIRDKKREKFEEKSQKMEEQNYDVAESEIYKKYSQKVSKKILFFFIDFLREKNYEYLVSPYESDS